MPIESLAIERWSLERLLPYAANARTHSESQVAQLAGSIVEFGFNVPVLVDVAVKRWQEFTGKEATLEATGATFAQVAEDKTNANAAA